MPGTPDPVLGSGVLTHAVASAVGLVLVAVVYAARTRIARNRLASATIGVVFATATLAVWVAARVVTDAFPSGFVEDPLAATGFLAFSFLVLAGFVVVTARLYACRGLVVPLVGLFGVTELVWWAFLHVRGETDALGMFIFFGPALMVLVLLAGGIEYVGRQVWKRLTRGGGRSVS
ncbi:hypothetical protein GJR96_11500 [Haloferax sp. MBLA0076]|uniref:Uncharacterized protein n=1 Tax=Haloferax litoreum TaxID=2666140 RepID=A0A6A8GI14_9EURY|nr:MULTISPECIES: hypothetical protein [Haloferax]KAB1194027.1 hypothetical protein Hfx1148_11450 [Haloferax sp. CBA1148]MRX22576.1 hypothetical protein [Haloferax litoreum]